MRPTALILTSLTLLASAPVIAADAAKVDPRVVEDCRKEGQANELSGVELEKFVVKCVAEFQGTQLSGSKKLPPGK